MLLLTASSLRLSLNSLPSPLAVLENTVKSETLSGSKKLFYP